MEAGDRGATAELSVQAGRNNSYFDNARHELRLTGFNGANALQITTTGDNSKVRIHYIIRGEPSFVHNFYIVFRLARTVGSHDKP